MYHVAQATHLNRYEENNATQLDIIINLSLLQNDRLYKKIMNYEFQWLAKMFAVLSEEKFLKNSCLLISKFFSFKFK